MDSTTASFVELESLVEGVEAPIIKNGLMFNRDKNFLYAMTPTKVSTGVIAILCFTPTSDIPSMVLSNTIVYFTYSFCVCLCIEIFHMTSAKSGGGKMSKFIATRQRIVEVNTGIVEHRTVSPRMYSCIYALNGTTDLLIGGLHLGEHRFTSNARDWFTLWPVVKELYTQICKYMM